MASNLAIAGKVSSKYVPSSWLYPLATNLALFLVTTQTKSNLFLRASPMVGLRAKMEERGEDGRAGRPAAAVPRATSRRPARARELAR